jgi:hypothetical protein
VGKGAGADDETIGLQVLAFYAVHPEVTASPEDEPQSES